MDRDKCWNKSHNWVGFCQSKSGARVVGCCAHIASVHGTYVTLDIAMTKLPNLPVAFENTLKMLHAG